MRKSIVLAAAIVSSLAISACGHGHKNKMKAKVAAAEATGDKKQQKRNIEEINADIKKIDEKLKAQGFFDLDTISMGKIGGMFNKLEPKQREEVKKLLGDLKGESEALIKAGKDVKGSEGDEAVSTGEKYKAKALAGIEKMNNQERSEKEAQSKSSND